MSSRPVAFVGDSHLLPGDDTVELFLDFLAGAPARFERLVLVGDIFDLWLARPHLHEEHHRRTIEGMAAARSAGLAIDYVVGNRDFGVEGLADAPFDRVASVLLPETGEAPAWLAEHGDLVNEEDRQYRSWRALSRSAPVLGTFLRLPAALGVPLSQWLERKMRTTNLAYKREFPMAHAVRRAAGHFERTGARYLVLGHFHQELRFRAGEGEVLVLPSWKTAPRHAEWDPAAGTMRFTDSV